MPQRFISKSTRRKYIRPIKNSAVLNKVEYVEKVVPTETPKKVEVAENPVEETVKVEKETKPKAKRTRKKPAVITEENNKEEKTDSDMDENIEKIKQVMGNDVEIPERKVKIEKRDKGLLERTENSTTLITEDNKLVLND